MADMQKVLGAVEEIYRAAENPDHWPYALESVADSIGAAAASFVFQKTDGALIAVPSPSIAKAQKEYEEGAWRVDYLAQRHFEQAMLVDGTVLSERDLATEEEIRTHPFFTVFRKKYGLGAFLAAMLYPVKHLPVIFVVHGAYGAAPFSEEQTALCQSMGRHVRQSLSLSLRLIEAEVGQDNLASALTRLSCGIFILDSNRNILFRNQLTDVLTGGDLMVDGAKLTILGGASENFANLCATVAGENGEGEVDVAKPVFAEGAGGKRVMLQVLPISANTPTSLVYSSASLLVLAVEQEANEPLDPLIIEEYLRLTPAEARLASLVGSGLSPKEAAERLQISIHTARTVLKRIFAKAGVGRQSELSAILASLASATLKSTVPYSN